MNLLYNLNFNQLIVLYLYQNLIDSQIDQIKIFFIHFSSLSVRLLMLK